MDKQLRELSRHLDDEQKAREYLSLIKRVKPPPQKAQDLIFDFYANCSRKIYPKQDDTVSMTWKGRNISATRPDEVTSLSFMFVNLVCDNKDFRVYFSNGVQINFDFNAQNQIFEFLPSSAFIAVMTSNEERHHRSWHSIEDLLDLKLEEKRKGFYDFISRKNTAEDWIKDHLGQLKKIAYAHQYEYCEEALRQISLAYKNYQGKKDHFIEATKGLSYYG